MKSPLLNLSKIKKNVESIPANKELEKQITEVHVVAVPLGVPRGYGSSCKGMLSPLLGTTQKRRKLERVEAPIKVD